VRASSGAIRQRRKTGTGAGFGGGAGKGAGNVAGKAQAPRKSAADKQ